MDIKLYRNFKKRRNSTRQPDPAYHLGEALASGRLKSPTSIMNPVIEFQDSIPYVTDLTHMNYAYIALFERYYYINDWTFDHGLWVATMEEDVLASNKLPISQVTAYVERAAATADGSVLPFWDGKIIDTYYPTKHLYGYVQQLLAPPWTGIAFGDGCYVVGVITNAVGMSAGGMVTYWAMTHNEMRQLANYLMSDQFYDDAGFPTLMTATQQMSHEVARGLINPMQYITSCMWFPCDTTKFTPNSAVPMNVGPWTVPTGSIPPVGRPIIGYVGYSEHFEFTLPDHPQAQTRGDYLNYSPYSRYTAYLPPFGSFPIDRSDIPNNFNVYAYMAVDGITGKATLQMFTHTSQYNQAFCFFQTSSMIGVPVQLTQITSDMMGSIQSVLSAGVNTVGAIGNLLTGNLLGAAGAGAAAVSNVGSAIQSAMPQVQTQGLPGSFLASQDVDNTLPRLTARFTQLVDEDLAERGRPLCQVRTINTLAGYIKCVEADVDLAPCLEPERDAIKRYMLTGFFFE